LFLPQKIKVLAGKDVRDGFRQVEARVAKDCRSIYIIFLSQLTMRFWGET
jgi:hypothetical protein